MRHHRGASVLLVAVVTTAALATSGALAPSRSQATSTYDKVMVIAEENEQESAVIGSTKAPYLNRLATTYGELTNMQAGYPVSCPSLAAYLLITSGNRDGICDDKDPSHHQLSQDNIFSQVASSGRQWREYAESMPSTCDRSNSANGVYLVRHAPPPYFTSEAKRCAQWDEPLGTTSSGALHDDLATGLPAYSFVTPNACDDMHGAPSCTGGLVARGDAWLASWMPRILAGKDFQSSRLVVIVTWDEGSRESNHIATIVIAPSIHGVRSATPYTHCSTLRATEDLLRLPRLGCATSAPAFASAFPL